MTHRTPTPYPPPWEGGRREKIPSPPLYLRGEGRVGGASSLPLIGEVPPKGGKGFLKPFSLAPLDSSPTGEPREDRAHPERSEGSHKPTDFVHGILRSLRSLRMSGGRGTKKVCGGAADFFCRWIILQVIREDRCPRGRPLRRERLCPFCGWRRRPKRHSPRSRRRR